MRNVYFYKLLIDPRSLKEFADGKTEITAVGVNAVTGILLVLAAAIAMSSVFTNGLIILLSILFGPLLGFVVSSSYSRLEFAVGRRMGGAGSLDDLYRIFAWSFLPVGVALLFYSLLVQLIQKPGVVAGLILFLPSLALVLLAVRSYCSNVVAIQKFTLKRGLAGMIITMVLFVILIIGFGTLILLFYNYGASENIKAL